jgi:hypothetical protein
VVFCSATVWAGVVAAQRPITCPNRQLQPERYVPYPKNKINISIFSKSLSKSLDSGINMVYTIFGGYLWKLW